MSAPAVYMNAILNVFEEGVPLLPRDVSEATGIDRKPAIKSLGTLVAHGCIERLEKGLFTITDEGLKKRSDGHVFTQGPQGPDVGKKRRPYKGSLRQKAWSAMRVMQVFSTAQIVEIVCDEARPQDQANLARYCSALCRAGFLMEMPTRAAGAAETSNGFKRYRMFNDTGETAPVHRKTKNEVLDQNTGEVHPCRV